MNEKELILKIQSLKKIKPNSTWVVSSKENIFKEQESLIFSWQRVFVRPAMAGFASLGFIAALMVSAQTASPGDALYTIKKISEKSRMALTSQDNRQDMNLLLAHRRLDEVSEIIKKQEVEKLSLAIKELESVKERMQKDFAQSIEKKPKEEAIKIAKSFAPSLLEIEDKQDLLIGSLGVAVDTGLSSNTAKELAGLLIEDYQERSLTEKDKELLERAKQEFETENYRTALRDVLEIGQEREVE
jgi:hypothetical protein